MRETGPTSNEGYATYLAGRAQLACDQHAKSRLRWTLADITAIRQLLDDRVRELVAEQRP